MASSCMPCIDSRRCCATGRRRAEPPAPCFRKRSQSSRRETDLFRKRSDKVQAGQVMTDTTARPIDETYECATPASARLYQEARRYIAGGVTRTTVHFAPHPLYASRGDGPLIWDADGTERLDFIGNYTALILGHRHPAVVAANEHEIALARELCERVPGLELVHFANSGTEATMYAMRLARAFTGRPAIARFEGC